MGGVETAEQFENRLVLNSSSEWSSSQGSSQAEMRDEIDMAISKCLED